METRHKKRLHHAWTYFRAVKLHYLGLALVIMIGVSALALRHNNQTMITLRDQVYQADKQGGDVEGALRNLRQYIYGHMNTNLTAGDSPVRPPIQLKYTYERLNEAAQAQAKQTNEQVYTDAQHYCEKLYPQSFSGGPRVPCIRDYIASHGVPIKTIPDSLYKFDFTSPRWSPDLAGWSVALAVIIGLLFIVRLTLPISLKRLDI